jgi:hypothetical protein
MALIAEFFLHNPDRVMVHGPVSCGFHSFTADGKSTFNWTRTGPMIDRSRGVSQTLQLGHDAAKRLLVLLLETFSISELIE